MRGELKEDGVSHVIEYRGNRAHLAPLTISENYSFHNTFITFTGFII